MSETRALLTDREREIIVGDADVSDSYRYQTISRVRRRFDRLDDDLDVLEEHGDLADELRSIVCGAEDVGQLRARIEELTEERDDLREENDPDSRDRVDFDDVREDVRRSLDDLEAALERGNGGAARSALDRARDRLDDGET